MRESRSAIRWAALTACALVAGGTSGCSALLRAGLAATGEAIAGDSDGRVALLGPLEGAAVPSDPPPGQVRSGYQHAPTPDWYAGLRARPHSMISSVFQSPAFDAGCQPVPIGLQQLMQVPNGAPAVPIERIGPFEIGVQGPAATLFTDGYLDRLAHGGALFRPGPPLADDHLACGFRSELYLRIGGSETTPIAVHR